MVTDHHLAEALDGGVLRAFGGQLSQPHLGIAGVGSLLGELPGVGTGSMALLRLAACSDGIVRIVGTSQFG
jgi:hypothetical protein